MPEVLHTVPDGPSEIESVVACLGDDAARLREQNPDDEMASNMDDAARLLARGAVQWFAWPTLQPAEVGIPDGALLVALRGEGSRSRQAVFLGGKFEWPDGRVLNAREDEVFAFAAMPPGPAFETA